MAQGKFDGVIEAVRYAETGQVEVVRAYERRGPAFSDGVLLDRETLIRRIQQGRRFVVGRRKPFLGGVFEVGAPVRLQRTAQGEILTTTNRSGVRDHLTGVPLF